MRVRYPGPLLSVIVDNVEIARGEEADLTKEQFERAEPLGVERVDGAAAEPTKEATKDSGK